MNCIHRIIAGRKQTLPPIEDRLLMLSATELATKIRQRELKCEDVMRSYYNRAQVVQPYINAITDARYEAALEEAIEIDKFLEKGLKTPEEIKNETPLLGVPFTCKEVLGIKGLHQTCGIYDERKNIAERDGDAPAFYRAAGAIPVTVTNVPELCFWWDTVNKIYGRTTNPYDNTRMSGGSSGGEAALIGAAGAVIGIGTDVSGSIRIPATLCGIYGHKPSSDVVSNRGYFPWMEPEEMTFDSLNTTGPMCRYAEDLLLLLKILSKNDPRLDLDKKVDFQNVKIYYLEEISSCPAIPAIKQAVKKAAKYFEKQYGTKATFLEMPELEKGLPVYMSKFLEIDYPSNKLMLADENGKVHIWLEILKCIFGTSKHNLNFVLFTKSEKTEKDQEYIDHLNQFDSLKRKFQNIFQEEAIFILPTLPDTAQFSHLSIPRINHLCYTPAFSHLGFPVTNVPTGMHDGLPIGIQVVSGHFNDRLTIAAAVELDKVFRGWKSPCSETTRKVWTI